METKSRAKGRQHNHSTKSNKSIKVKVQGPKASILAEVKTDKGANSTVMKAEILQELDWVELEPADVHIRGCSGIAEPCLEKATLNLEMGKR